MTRDRRQFILREADQSYLDSLGLAWEALVEGGNFWVVVYDWPLGEGYTASHIDVAIKIEPGYPDSQLDMAYFHPAVVRADGGVIRATEASQALDGKSWQRWSRHRTGANPWVEGDDDLQTHMVLVQDWLEREFSRRAA